MVKDARAKGDPIDLARTITLVDRIKQWIKDMWANVRNAFSGKWGDKELKDLTVEEFAKMPLKDLMERGFDPTKIAKDTEMQKRFIGEKGVRSIDKSEGKTTRMDNCKVVEEMEKAKKDARTIKIATGWERGADGKWRYEEPDLEYRADGKANYLRRLKAQPWFKEFDELSEKLIDGEETLTEAEQKRFDELADKVKEIREQEENRDKIWLDDYVEDDTLFKAYPQLKQVKLEFYDNASDGNAGSYNDNDGLGVIKINLANPDDVSSTLIHEVQHAIQHIEGFAGGGNLDIGERLTKSTDSLSYYQHKFLKDLELYEDERYNPRGDVTPTEVIHAFAWLGTYGLGLSHKLESMNEEELWKEYDRLKEIDRKRVKTPYDGYRALAGEVEARNAQSRRNMTDEERRQSLAEETEDVAREKQIILNEGGGVSCSRVTDEDLKKKLEAEPKVKVYRAMQQIDGKLYPSMATRIKGEDGKKQLVEPIKLGEWEQADEHPELVKDGKFTLDKANGSTVPAAYNPYIHTSRSPLNDQFSSAYKRPNLVTVEVDVPASELASGYKAEGAKDAVGEMDWHSGPVSSQLAKAGDPRNRLSNLMCPLLCDK